MCMTYFCCWQSDFQHHGSHLLQFIHWNVSSPYTDHRLKKKKTQETMTNFSCAFPERQCWAKANKFKAPGQRSRSFWVFFSFVYFKSQTSGLSTLLVRSHTMNKLSNIKSPLNYWGSSTPNSYYCNPIIIEFNSISAARRQKWYC